MNARELELTDVLMKEVGLYVTADGNVFDQDLLIPVLYKNKTLKYPIATDRIKRESESLFNPMSNLDLMRIIFSVFVQKQEQITGVPYVAAYNLIPEDRKHAIGIKDANGVEIVSGRYHNLVLSYLDLIMKISDDGFDTSILPSYDSLTLCII